jgi:hypothetical protein
MSDVLHRSQFAVVATAPGRHVRRGEDVQIAKLVLCAVAGELAVLAAREAPAPQRWTSPRPRPGRPHLFDRCRRRTIATDTGYIAGATVIRTFGAKTLKPAGKLRFVNEPLKASAIGRNPPGAGPRMQGNRFPCEAVRLALPHAHFGLFPLKAETGVRSLGSASNLRHLACD